MGPDRSDIDFFYFPKFHNLFSNLFFSFLVRRRQRISYIRVLSRANKEAHSTLNDTICNGTSEFHQKIFLYTCLNIKSAFFTIIKNNNNLCIAGCS